MTGKVLVNKTSGVTLESGKIYNLGSVRAPFNWGVVGDFNNWDIASPALLYDTDADGIYELKDQSLGENGFKFVRVPECSWDYSFGRKEDNFFDTTMNGGWYDAYTNNGEYKNFNIKVSDTSKKWDIYIYEFTSGDWGQGLKFTVLDAGSTTPSK